MTTSIKHKFIICCLTLISCLNSCYSAEREELHPFDSAIDTNILLATRLLDQSLGNPFDRNTISAEAIFHPIFCPIGEDLASIGLITVEPSRITVTLEDKPVKSILQSNKKLFDFPFFQGQVRGDLLEIAELIYNHNKNLIRHQNNCEYIFSGFGHGGSVAAILTAFFYNDMSEHMQNNQANFKYVKSISFYPEPFSNLDYRKNLERKLSLENIIYFSPYFSFNFLTNLQHVGIPMYILPSEILRDDCVRPLELILKPAGILWICCQNLLRMKNFHTGSKNVNSSSESESSKENPPTNLGSEFSKLGLISNGVAITLAHPYPYQKLRCLLKSTPLSSTSMQAALRYARGNRGDFYGSMDIREIGTPSLICRGRGLGGLLIKMIIG